MTAALAKALAPGLDAREWRLLGLLGTAAFFNRYDESLHALLLVQIQADLGIAEARVGLLGSMIGLGALPAFGAAVLADRVGRRRMLLATITGYTIFTAATALAPGFAWFVALQFAAHAFLAAELVLSLVVVVEEFEPGHRGFGVGVLGLLGALGTGLALGLFGVVEHVPLGWRGLFLVGVGPLVGVALLRARGPGDGVGWLAPLAALLRRAPGRLAAMAAVAFLVSFSNAPVDFLLPKFFQEAQGWTPARFAQMGIALGALGLTGHLVVGRLSDRLGRRRVGVVLLVAEPLLAVALYRALGVPLPILFLAWVFASVGNDVILQAFRSELFATAVRSTASGAVALLATLGGVLALACEGLLYGVLGDHWSAVQVLAATGLLAALVAAAFFPETANRPLESIAPEPEAAPAAATGPALGGSQPCRS